MLEKWSSFPQLKVISMHFNTNIHNCSFKKGPTEIWNRKQRYCYADNTGKYNKTFNWVNSKKKKNSIWQKHYVGVVEIYSILNS